MSSATWGRAALLVIAVGVIVIPPTTFLVAHGAGVDSPKSPAANPRDRQMGAVGPEIRAATGLPVPPHFGTIPGVISRASSGHLPSALRAATVYPRVVLVEAFTGVWCIHCPAESQALYNIDRNTSHGVLAIGELHVCAFPRGQGPCLDDYVPPDGTSDARATFYSTCGYPDVFIDGGHPLCGATNSVTQMQGLYQRAIANASGYGGNVSIGQDTKVVAGSVIVHAYITSGINGSFNAITYLLEYIGKRNVSNGYGAHDIGNVVRETLSNRPVNLVTGNTVGFNATGPLNSTWNQANLSVVTLVQQNSTRTIENANLAPVPNPYPPHLKVTFVEDGLPTGTPWSVTLRSR